MRAIAIPPTARHRPFFSFFFAVLATFLAPLLLTACSKPDPRNTVVLYTSADQEYAQQIIDAFRKKHPGITVLARFDSEATKTTGLVERLRAEKKNPQADVFWSSEPFLTQKLADEGLLAWYDSHALTGRPENFTDPQRRWYGFACRARVIAYSPDRVPDPPTSWQDLTDPRFKNRIVMADPNFGTTRGHIASIFTLWGDENAQQYLRDLKSNGLRIVTSNSQAVREINAGLADLALTDTDDVWAAQRNGYQVELVYPRHGPQPGQGTLLIPNTVALVANRPPNPAAELFLMYLLSNDAQRILYESDSHNIPVPDAPWDLDFTIDQRYRIDDPFTPDVEQVTAAMPRAIAAANRILLGRDR